MAIYEFECPNCGLQREVEISIKDDEARKNVKCTCGTLMEQFLSKPPTGVFRPTPGKETGVYALDYGRRATEDLTVPGKMERLKKEGRIVNPFD